MVMIGLLLRLSRNSVDMAHPMGSEFELGILWNLNSLAIELAFFRRACALALLLFT